ncbi:MAG: DUF5131 family protein, partial [Candidatus Eremiobacteraeota bacterium]|nr:DUF5131 family protein [Candidatus Eremiobacteraeota bacterium]
MGKTTIEWAHRTMNPWRGCTKVSDGCDHCYAEVHFSTQLSGIQWGKGKPRKRTSQAYWNTFLSLDRKLAKCGIRERVFCGSLCDVFDPEVPEQWRTDLFELIAKTTNLDWLLLTKRPQLALQYDFSDLPIWLGTSVENQLWHNVRIKRLREARAKIKFLSVEPLLGPIKLELASIDWVIVGGESGPHCRPFDVAWARAIRDQCREADVKFFMKQLGGHPYKRDCLS